MVFCNNCQSEIEDSKMFLHEGFCKKNIRYCFQCKEKIPIDEYEEHLENHNKKEEPQEKENKEDIKNNKNENVNIECQYCSLLVDQSEIEEHEKMCGSRTVQCEICGQYVQTRLLNQHLNVIHDTGYKPKKNINIEEINKKKQIEEDEILARKLAEEYSHFDMDNSFRHF